MEIIEKSRETDEDEFPIIPLYNLDFVARIRNDFGAVIEILKNTRALMQDGNSTHEMFHLNWDLILKEDNFKVESYRIFVYTMLRLIEIDANDKINRELSFEAGRTFISLLSLPGARRCCVYQPTLIIKYFQLLCFHLKNKSENESNYRYLEIQITQMLSECKKGKMNEGIIE